MMSTHKPRRRENHGSFRTRGEDTSLSILSFFEALNTPKSLAAWLLFRSGEHKQLVDLDVNPADYISVDAFRRDLAATSFLSKAKFLKIDVDKSAVALEKFKAAEEQCLRTNLRLLHPDLSDENIRLNESLLSVMARKIDQCLGDLKMSDVVDKCGWGPGASFHLRGDDTSATNKFLRERGITHDLYPLHAEIASFAWPTWEYHCRTTGGYSLVAGGYLTTVPKNAKVDRVIAIEPGINLWYQKAIGRLIRSRLRRWGINLNSQEINQNLSRHASISGGMATIDFSAASDTISRELVREVLPHTWFCLLDCVRSKNVQVEGAFIPLEKFSSMGNGFTFELESLIFAAAAFAVCEYLEIPTDGISVYGDDVIIPCQALPLFQRFCDFIGFTVNTDKSHSSGYYRESCGSHWYNGFDVKPIFLKERIRNAEDVFKLANAVRRLAHRHNSHCGCDQRFYSCWTAIRDRLPRTLWLAIPEELGDGGFVVNFDEACPPRARRSSGHDSSWLEGFSVRHLHRVGITYSADHIGKLLSQLWLTDRRSLHLEDDHLHNGITVGTESVELGNFVTLRRRSRVSLSRSIVPKWYDFGPWI